MSKKILVVESDAAFSHKLKDELERNGFEVQETTDGKGAFELIRRERPQLVVLAVELAAGQSGYLVCGKIKKDDELKPIPVVIIGKDADGFEGHKKLKTRAEEYLKKPFAPEALTVKVGVLIGMPEAQSVSDDLVVEDDSISLDGPAGGGTLQGDPDLDMLDDAFANLTPPSETPADIEPAEIMADSADVLDLSSAEEDLALDNLDGAESGSASLDIELLEEAVESPARPPSTPRSRPPSIAAVPIDDAELLQLRARVRELEEKMGGLESQLNEKEAELAATKASSGSSRDAASLKENLLKKDKEILRLKQELNEKDGELVELREREAGFEKDANSAAGEIAKREAQLKALSQKVDQLSADKKKGDTALDAAKDEARAAVASQGALQAELGSAQEQLATLRGQLEALEAQSVTLRQDVEDARSSARNEVESLRADLEAARAELSSLQADHASLRETHESHLLSHTEETNQLRSRATELEDANAKNEERVVKAYQKIKGDEKLREKTRKAISVALQLLDDNASANVIDESDLNA